MLISNKSSTHFDLLELTPNSVSVRRNSGQHQSVRSGDRKPGEKQLTLGVARDGPFALLDHVLDRLGDLGAGLGNVVELQKRRMGIVSDKLHRMPASRYGERAFMYADSR